MTPFCKARAYPVLEDRRHTLLMILWQDVLIADFFCVIETVTV